MIFLIFQHDLAFFKFLKPWKFKSSHRERKRERAGESSQSRQHYLILYQSEGFVLTCLAFELISIYTGYICMYSLLLQNVYVYQSFPLYLQIHIYSQLLLCICHFLSFMELIQKNHILIIFVHFCLFFFYGSNQKKSYSQRTSSLKKCKVFFINIQLDEQTNIQIDSQTNIQIDCQMNRQIYRQIVRQIYRQIDCDISM